jgi:antibiotic biosynthesis monooxygenase (ABM) superfamily enzyme
MSQVERTRLHGSRLFVLAWIGVYPMVTIITWVFSDELMALTLRVRTLVLTGLIVGYMVFAWIPFVQWLNGTSR